MSANFIASIVLYISYFSCLFAQNINIATVDSGFGGYFSTKAIESRANIVQQNYSGLQIAISHYGDTANAPYGSKQPEEIASLATKMIILAHENGADHIFLACNTASSHFDKIITILRGNPKTATIADKTYSIIESSLEHLKKSVDLLLNNEDEIFIAILSTPATLKSEVYTKGIQNVFGLKTVKPLEYQFFEQKKWLPSQNNSVQSFAGAISFSPKDQPKKKIHLYHYAPSTWVEMIEHGASQADFNLAIKRDLSALTKLYAPPNNKKFHIVSEFCTHFPVVHSQIQESLETLGLQNSSTEYVQQGKIFTQVFTEKVESQLGAKKTSQAQQTPIVSPIYITGNNIEETKNLVKTVFPEQKEIRVYNTSKLKNISK